MIGRKDAGPDEVDQLMDRGLQALETEQYDAAADLFRRVVQRAPFRHDARRYLALALDRQFSHGSGAAAARSPAPTDGPSSVATVSGRARPTRIRFPIWVVAVSIAITALAIGSVALVVSYLREHGIGQWVTNLSKPKGTAASPALEQILADMKKADSAVTREQYDEALNLLSKTRETAAALNNPPDLKRVEEKIADVSAAKAGAFFSKENYDKALEAAQEGLKYSESSIPLNYLTGRCYERKAMHAFSANDKTQGRAHCEKACEVLEKVVKADPDHLPALDLLGKTYSKFNEIKAIETWRRIVKQAPDSPEGRAAKNYLQFRQIQ